MIELHGIYGGYGKRNVLHNVSLSFPDGQITALVGPNGCGKSTLLQICAGLLQPKQGDILINNTPLCKLSRTERAQYTALLPQSRTVPDITAGAFVLHGRFPWLDYPRIYHTEDRKAAEDAMWQAGILDKQYTLLSSLSGGERQRVYIAMVLAQNTANILLDEPATYLDISHQLELQTHMRRLRGEGKCVVAVLHDLRMAMETADRIAVLKDGKVIFCGAPKDAAELGALENAFNIRLSRTEQYRFDITK